MRTAFMLTRRNLRIFFRDKSNVFFSLLSALILFVLYAMFLGKMQVDFMVANSPGLLRADVEGFVQSWVFAGITMITTLTAGLGSLNNFVEDRFTGRFKDFLVSPIRRWQLVFGYLASSFAVSVIMSMIVLIVGQLYMYFSGYAIMDLAQFSQTVGYILLFAAVFSALSSFAASFIKSAGAFSSFSTIVGTIIGFFAGIYIPISQMPDGVATFLNYLPFAQAATLIRAPYTQHYLDVLSHNNAEIAKTFQDTFGITLKFGSSEASTPAIIAIFVVLVVVLFGLSAWRMSKKIR